MTELTLPDISLPATNNQTLSLRDFAGKNVVLYFYPKDSTPGCTMESKAFRDHADEFASLNTVILGVSRDTIKSHEKFKEKHCMPFDLLSDADSELCKYFNVLGEKTLFGKKYFDMIIRSTFLFDTNGKLVREWRKVKVKDHVKEVLGAVKELS